MMTKARQAGGVLTFKDRDLSPADDRTLWERLPALAWLTEAYPLARFREDFHLFARGADGWVVSSDGGTAALSTADPNGVLSLASASGQGVQAQLAGLPVLCSSSRWLWMEAYVKASALTGRFALGLAPTTTSAISGSSLAPTDGIFLHSLGGDGSFSLSMRKAGVSSSSAVLGTLAAGTLARLGFVLDASAGTLTGYMDGVAGASMTTLSANLPVVGLSPFLCCRAAGTAPVLSVDYLELAAGRA